MGFWAWFFGMAFGYLLPFLLCFVSPVSIKIKAVALFLLTDYTKARLALFTLAGSLNGTLASLSN
jgi:hypothetical protein